ncbi:head-tail adaptor [Pseudomonas phage PSA-KC1]
MAITIVVEDGSGVTNANSYVSVADARIYASNRGVELPLDDDELAAMLIRSTDYLKRRRAAIKAAALLRRRLWNGRELASF